MEKISVLVVTFNRLTWLRKNLNSIFSQIMPFNKVYIVNNASTDGTTEFLKELEKRKDNVVVINLKNNIGGAGGFYEGIKKFLELSDKNEWISLMDDDCILDDKFVEEMLKECIDKSNCYVPFVYKLETNELNEYFFKGMKKLEGNQYIKDTFPFNGYTINKEMIKKIGLPEKEYFIYMDDYEYCYRVLANGGKNIGLKNVKLFHPTKNMRTQKKLCFKLTNNELSRLGAYYGTRNLILCKMKHKKIVKYSFFKIIAINIYRILGLLSFFRIDLIYLMLLGLKDGFLNKKINRGRV